jgi:hypothetical protein
MQKPLNFNIKHRQIYLVVKEPKKDCEISSLEELWGLIRC